MANLEPSSGCSADEFDEFCSVDDSSEDVCLK
jgi:hypothetical protein